LVVTPDFRPV